MLVTPTGGRLWRFRYRHSGVEKLLTLGAYPDVSLKRAREKRDDARKLVADGTDPSAKRQAERNAAANTFTAVADEWLLTKKKVLASGTWQRDRDQIHKWVVPYLGNRLIALIEAPELLEVLKRIEAKGIADTAHRTREVCGRVFRYAIATGRAKHDITADLKGTLALRSWANYFKLGPVDRAYRSVHTYVTRRLRRWLCIKHEVRGSGCYRYPDDYLHDQLGLVRIRQLVHNLPWANP